MKNLKMVDLHGQYLKIKPEIDAAIQEVLENTAFINGPQVSRFNNNLASYLKECVYYLINIIGIFTSIKY